MNLSCGDAETSLADYTKFHFGEEERLSEDIGYLKYRHTKVKHEELRKTVEESFTEMLGGPGRPHPEFVEQVNKNVTEWLLSLHKTF